jgi:hypothetical protein
MRIFQLVRSEDVSGVSGTGIVAEGVEFRDGQVALSWVNYGSVGVYKDIELLLKIHGHDGRTEVMYLADLS